MNETAQLAKFTAEMTYDKLPPQAVAVAKQCILDWLGVARLPNSAFWTGSALLSAARTKNRQKFYAAWR